MVDLDVNMARAWHDPVVHAQEADSRLIRGEEIGVENRGVFCDVAGKT
jgi:hypothetical protein